MSCLEIPYVCASEAYTGLFFAVKCDVNKMTGIVRQLDDTTEDTDEMLMLDNCFFTDSVLTNYLLKKLLTVVGNVRKVRHILPLNFNHPLTEEQQLFII